MNSLDPSLLLKQSMENYPPVIRTFNELQELEDLEDALGLNGPHHSQKRSSETCSEDDERSQDWRSASQALQPWDIESGVFPWLQSNNQPGMNNRAVPNPNEITGQASQSANISSSAFLKRSSSVLSETERAQRKKKNDQAYRERIKKQKYDMQFSLEMLTEENEALKKENESLKEDNTLMNGTLKDQEKEIDRLRSDLYQLKREYEKQNVLVQTLSTLLSDPVRLENEKLKDENEKLRKNAINNLPLLAEENAKLRIDNKVLKVQNDALCGKIISDNEKKREQKLLLEVMPS